MSLAQYQASVDAMRTSAYMKFPAHVHIETYTLCNAACSFCPYPGLDRKGTRMPDSLIDKILTELQAVPRGLPFQISPLKVNEPLLDTRMHDIIGEIGRKLPSANVTLTTNGSPLTDSHIARLASARNLHALWISVNECTAEAYERTMALPFERTKTRLAALHECKSSGGFRPAVVLSRVGDGSAADAEFSAWAQRTFPAFEHSVIARGSWLGQVDTNLPDVPDVGCIRWFELSITATGKVAHCCMDGQAQFPVGDAATENVLAIYNAPHYRRLRESALTRAAFDPCRGCTFF